LGVRYVFYSEPEGFGCRLEPPITRAAPSTYRFAGVKTDFARVVELAHEIGRPVAQE